jgi:hypothetical protein
MRGLFVNFGGCLSKFWIVIPALRRGLPESVGCVSNFWSAIPALCPACLRAPPGAGWPSVGRLDPATCSARIVLSSHRAQDDSEA